MTCRSSNAHLLASLLSFFFPLPVATLEEMQKGHHNHRNWVSLLPRWNVPRCEGLKDSLLLICRSNGSLDICGNLTHSFCDTQFLHYAPHLSGCVKCCHCMSSVKHPPLQKEDEKYFPCKPAFCLDQTLSWSVESWIDNLQCFTVAQHFHIKILFFFFYPCRSTRPWSGPLRRQNCHSPSFLSFICLVVCQSPLWISGALLGSRQESEPDLVLILFLLLFAVKTNQ